MKTLIFSAFMAMGLFVANVAVADDDYYEDRMEHQAQKRAKVSYAQAKRQAIKAVGGGVVTGIEFEMGRGYHYYDVEVRRGYTDYDVRINAQTGAVVFKKVDD